MYGSGQNHITVSTPHVWSGQICITGFTPHVWSPRNCDTLSAQHIGCIELHPALITLEFQRWLNILALS